MEFHIEALKGRAVRVRSIHHVCHCCVSFLVVVPHSQCVELSQNHTRVGQIPRGSHPRVIVSSSISPAYDTRVLLVVGTVYESNRVREIMYSTRGDRVTRVPHDSPFLAHVVVESNVARSREGDEKYAKERNVRPPERLERQSQHWPKVKRREDLLPAYLRSEPKH